MRENSNNNDFGDAEVTTLAKLATRWGRALTVAVFEATRDDPAVAVSAVVEHLGPVSLIIALELHRFLQIGAVPDDLDESIADPRGGAEG